MTKWTENEKNKAIELLKNGNSYKQIAELLNRTVKSVQRKLEGYHSTYRSVSLYHELHCRCCGEKFKSLITEKRIFCSKKCQLQNIIDDKKIDYTKIKNSKCIDCGCDVKIKNNTNYSTVRCEKCKKIYDNKKCKFCGDIINNKKNICDDCKKYMNIKLFKNLNLTINKKLSKVNDEAKNILSELYYDKKYSRLQISELLGIDKKSLYIFFVKNNFELRNISDSIYNAIYQGRLKRSELKNQYKTGWHKTWNNNDVYYRSSYELDYCYILDEQKIEYTMEKIRIEYWDSILNKKRIAIPDFYLSKTNELVEIKSNWTFDEQNMKDKILAYKNNGYKVKIILEHKEYNINYGDETNQVKVLD